MYVKKTATCSKEKSGSWRYFYIALFPDFWNRETHVRLPVEPPVPTRGRSSPTSTNRNHNKKINNSKKRKNLRRKPNYYLGT